MTDGARKKKILPIVTAVLLVIVAACVAACNGNADTKPTLTFMNGDSVFRTYELNAGEAITDLGMPAKEGYTFTGWKDGEGTDYVPGTMPEESLTVYAQFRANTYTIAFTAGGGTSGSLSDIEASYDADVTLPSSGVSLQGRGIKGYTDVEGSTDVKWQPGATVRNLTAEDGATVTLYVLFEDEAAAIDFIIEDGVVTGYTGYGEHITLPAEATAIADGAFAGADFLKTVTVPDTYTAIGFGAFEGCNAIEKLTVPFIGGSAEENTYLAYIFGASHYLDNNYTYQMSVITDEETGETTATEIDEESISGAFYIPRSLRVVTINAPLAAIGEGAFYSAFGLEKVLFSEYETEEGSGEYAYPVRSVGAHAFEYCHFLGYDSEIGTYVTNDWLGDVETFGEAAFKGYMAGNYYTSRLMYVGELSAVKTIADSAFEASYRISDLSFGDNLVSIGDRAFYANIFMQKVVIPDSVKTIGEEAFAYADYITSVEIGAGVESIGDSAFAMDIGLREVIFRGDSAITFGEKVFSGVVPTDEGQYMPDETGNCNEDLKFFFATEAGQTAIGPSLAAFSNADTALIGVEDTTEYFYLGGSSYAFTATFGPSTVTIHDTYNRAGFGLPYMVGVMTDIPDADLYDTDEDMYIVTFMADQLHFYLKKTVTYTGMYTHYYNYIVPSVELTQIMDDVYAAYTGPDHKIKAVQFGDENNGWCIQQNIFGQIRLLHNGEAVRKGYDAEGKKLDEEALIVNGGILQMYASELLPRTLVYRQLNMYFEPILTYYFTYIPAAGDSTADLVYNGEVVPDLSANPELGDYDNYLFGDYTTADGKYTVRINEAVDQFVLSEKGVGDEYTPIYDETYTAAADAEYGAYDVTEPDPEDPEGVYERVYKDYALNEITTDAGTVQVVFRDFYTHILDRADSLEINLYAICDVTIDGTTYRLYNNKLYSRQDCYNVSSQGERRDHYTIIQYEQFVTYSYEGVETTVTEYPAYVEYTNGDTYMYGSMTTSTENGVVYSFHFTGNGAETIDRTVVATVTDANQGIFTTPYGAATREYVPYYELEENKTFTNGNTSVWLDGYGNGTLYIDGEEQWSGTYSLSTGTVVANVFVTENTYYYMYEYVLTGPTGQTFYFAPNFYDAYDGTLKAGDMLVPDENRNKTYVSVEYTDDGTQLITSLFACSGYDLGLFYIMTDPNGDTLPYDMYIMAPYTNAYYEKVEGTENTYRIYDMYGEGFFLCEFTDNMIAASATASYPEMVIEDDYAGWWHERVAMQISGEIHADMDTLERLQSREEMGVYRTPDGYTLYLDGKGAATLYDDSGAMEESNILAEGTFMSYDDSVLSTLSYRADMNLTFKGGSEPVVFSGRIYPTTGRLEMPVTIDGHTTDGFAKETAVDKEYANSAGGTDKIVVYTDGYACYYRPAAEIPFDFGTFSAYQPNPDPANAMADPVTAEEGEELLALRVDADKTVLTLDDSAATYTVKATYAARDFKYGYYTATVHITSEITEYEDDENYELMNYLGYDIWGIKQTDGTVEPYVATGSEYAKTFYMFFSPEDQAAGDPDGATAEERADNYYYYEPFGAQYGLTQCKLYEDGEYTVAYIHLDIIENIRTGWYYESTEDDTCYFVMPSVGTLTVYTWAAEHSPFYTQG